MYLTNYHFLGDYLSFLRKILSLTLPLKDDILLLIRKKGGARMRTAGIICEYNPFHTGHKRQIDMLRGMGYDCIVCVMSGNYTQRGEPAIFDKYTRAESAIMGGADVVLDLPFPYSSFSAEGFADAGVHILSSIGVDAICFGSECGDAATLERAADAVLSPEFKEIYSNLTRSGRGSAAAYFDAIGAITQENATLLSNDILGISYIAAIKKLGAKLDILPIKRDGAAYNEKLLDETVLPSASAIRERIKGGTGDVEADLFGYIPDKSLSVLSKAHKNGFPVVFTENIGDKILSFFRLMSANEIAARAISRSMGGDAVAEDGCGICQRLCNVARECPSLAEFLQKSYTAKFTDARINRVVLFSLLGVSDAFLHTVPQYTTLLAANGVGREFLSSIRKDCDFPIITKPADAPDSVQKTVSEAADALYAEAMGQESGLDFFIKSHPFMLK